MSGPLAASQHIFNHDITAERWRQLKRWGQQSHPDGTGSLLDRQHANAARQICESAFRLGVGRWRHILLEEVWEALAEVERGPLRAELVQVATVCIAWIECLDARAGDRASVQPDPPKLAGKQEIVPGPHVSAGVEARSDLQRWMVSA